MMIEPLPRVLRPATSRRAFWLVAGAVFGLDLATKWLAFAVLEEAPDGVVWIAEGVLGFVPAVNHGAAFSLLGSLPGSRYILIIIGVALLGMLMRMARQAAFAPVWWALAALSGGAAANLADRAWYGYVRDFLKVGWWPTFNVADIGITAGVAVLLIHLLRADGARGGEEASAP